MNRFLEKSKKIILNLLLPKKCLGCGQADTYLCPACFNKVEINPNNTCFFCGRITWQGKICINCQKENYLDRIISATEYKNPLIRKLIKNFKYHYVKELAQPLSRLLIRSLENIPNISNSSNILVIPVPLYKTRERGRGFNQSELLAKEVAGYFNLPLKTNILKRTVPTEPQVNIKDDEKRKANIKSAFDISFEFNTVRGKIIILVDDVTTTGATLIETAKVLKKSGANEVWGLVVAKG